MTPQQKTTRDFLQHHLRIVRIFTAAAIALPLLGLVTILAVSGLLSAHPLASVALIAGTSGILLLSGFVIAHVFLRPTKDIIQALLHVSGEPSATPPPNPNSSNYEKTGFKTVLQTIYGLSSGAATPATPAQDSQPATSPLEAALNATVCGFATMDSTRRITYANNATPLAINPDGSKHLDIIFPEDDTLEDWLVRCDNSAVKAERTWSRVSNKLPNEEGRRFFDVIAVYDKGAVAEVTFVLVDRTKLYSVGEEELDFIAFAAHELRGPITVIRGYIDVLTEELADTLQADQHELFRRLAVSASRLSGYVNNILNTSRYDRRHLKMHVTETTVADIYDTIKDDMSLRASSQNRLLAVSIPADLPSIAADSASLGEVFANLIDNAIKYSNEGGAIAVGARLAGDNVEIWVEDHGIGMPGNVIGNLFQKFYRSHRSRETVAGTGIGLYISKAIVESHGGTISVKSEEGKGSIFTVSIPTFRSVSAALEASGNTNASLMKKTDSGVWIKNHSSFRG